MRIFPAFLVLAFAPGAFAAVPVPSFPETTRSALGDAAQVFEIVGGEATVGSSLLKRVEVGRDTVVFTFRNESPQSIAPEVSAEFFNSFGMRIFSIGDILAREAVPPGGVVVKQFNIEYPDIETVFERATVRLPRNWKSLRFVGVRFSEIAKLSATQDSATAPRKLDPKSPHSRSSVVRKQVVRPSILVENKFGTTNIGPTAVSALWSNYGAYLNRMIESVQIQWEIFLGESKVYPASGRTVTVKFVMDSNGQITKIASPESTASDSATQACMRAISRPAPYGVWTDDMKAVLGEQQEITFTFYYQ